MKLNVSYVSYPCLDNLSRANLSFFSRSSNSSSFSFRSLVISSSFRYPISDDRFIQTNIFTIPYGNDVSKVMTWGV